MMSPKFRNTVASTQLVVVVVVLLLSTVTSVTSITSANVDNQVSPLSTSSAPSSSPAAPVGLHDDAKKNAKRDAVAEVAAAAADDDKATLHAGRGVQADSSAGLAHTAPPHYQSPIYSGYPYGQQYYAAGAAVAPQIFYVKAPTQNLHNSLGGPHGGLSYAAPIKFTYAAAPQSPSSPGQTFTLAGPAGHKQLLFQSPYQPISNYPALVAYSPHGAAGKQQLHQSQPQHHQQQQQQQQQQYEQQQQHGPSIIFSQPPPPQAQQLPSQTIQYSQLALAYATPAAVNHPHQHQQQQQQQQYQQQQHQPHQPAQIISNYIPHGYQLATVAPGVSPLQTYQQVQSASAPTQHQPHNTDVYQQQQPQRLHPLYHQQQQQSPVAHAYSFVTTPTALSKSPLTSGPGPLAFYAGPSGNHIYQSASTPPPSSSSSAATPQYQQHLYQPLQLPYHQSQSHPDQRPQSFTYSSYQHQPSGQYTPSPIGQKLLSFSPSPPYSQPQFAHQYKTTQSTAPPAPAPTAHSASPAESATSYATFSQHLSAPHPGAVAASYGIPTAQTPATKQQHVLAQPQHYAAYASPSLAGHQSSSDPAEPQLHQQQQYAGSATALHPSFRQASGAQVTAYNGPPLLAAAATSPQHVYATAGGGGGPSATHGAIHYGTHLFHPSAGKYGYGPVAPPSKIVYA